MALAPTYYSHVTMKPLILNSFFNITECFVVEFAELLESGNFFANLDFVERTDTTLVATRLFSAEPQFADLLQHTALLDTS